jgi:hypothetical protein
MKDQNFVEGITILMQHYKDKNGYHLGAERQLPTAKAVGL